MGDVMDVTSISFIQSMVLTEDGAGTQRSAAVPERIWIRWNLAVSVISQLLFSVLLYMFLRSRCCTVANLYTFENSKASSNLKQHTYRT